MRRSLALFCLATLACGAPPKPQSPTSSTRPTSQARESDPASAPPVHQDPTVRGARLVPETLDLSSATLDASGNARGILRGVRYVTGAHGTMQTSTERLDNVSSWFAVPPRLGGGYLFLANDTVFRADDWLGHAHPIFRTLRGPPVVSPGLDRIYVSTSSGPHVTHGAFDARTGRPLDLGPWPPDPHVGAYVALDGWRAIALTDIQGPVTTTDAGRSWRPLAVPVHVERLTPVRRDVDLRAWVTVAPGSPAEAVILADEAPRAPAAAATVAAADKTHCYVLLGSSFELSPLPGCEEARPGDVAIDPTLRVDVKALKQAIQDGWPLRDGTAIVAEAGTLTRVALNDGSIVSVKERAFDPKLTRCHAVSLARAHAETAFGFVCGEPSGVTVLAAYDEARAELVPSRTFSSPRIAEASGGSWLVHGPCADAASSSGARYCVGTKTDEGPSGYAWREYDADGTGGAVSAGVMDDGRFAQLSIGHSLDEAHLILTNAAGARESIPLRFPEMPRGARLVMERGVWLGDLTARGAGVVGAWVTYGGTVVGVEIASDGAVRVGPHVVDLGSPFVSGRYGLAWSRSRRGYETTDGGQSWTSFPQSAALAVSAVRACGPVGCIAEGWLRVGWGEQRFDGPSSPPQTPLIRPVPPAPLSLTCELTDATSATSAPPPPHVAPPETLVTANVRHGFDFSSHASPLAEVFAWGPTRGDWQRSGRWSARWRSPFAGTSTTVSTLIAPSPFRDAAHAASEIANRANPAPSTVAVSEDGAHALLLTRPAARPHALTTLDEGAKAGSIVRADGEPWGPVQSALRIGGDWYVAVLGDQRKPEIDVFRAEAHGARLFARIPHHLPVISVAASQVSLARSIEGASLGLVVAGEVSVERNVLTRWVIPIELESGQVGTPELLGAADLSDRAEVTACGDGIGSGWVLETAWPGANVSLGLGGAQRTLLQQVSARLRLSTDRVCIERLAGETDLTLAQLKATRGASSIPAGQRARLAAAVSDGAATLELRCATPPEPK